MMHKKQRHIFIDLDNTLFKDSWISTLLIKISRFVFRQALRFQYINAKIDTLIMIHRYNDCKIIILTGRNYKYRKITSDQLSKFKIDYDQLILAPDKGIVTDWKRKEIKRITRGNSYIWYDDLIKHEVEIYDKP